MSQSESDVCPGSPTSTASISINETVPPPGRTISDVEVLPHKVQLIYHGVDKEPEPFPPPTSPSEQLSQILPTRIQAETSARASLPTEVWDMVFSNVERWQERKDLTQAWTSIRLVCRGFKAAVERVFKEQHVPKLVLHFEGDIWNKHFDTFSESKVQRLLAAEAARYPDKFPGEIPRNSFEAQHTIVGIRQKAFEFKRIDDRAPRRVVLEDLSTDDAWSWLTFRRLSELATGQDDFCLGNLGDPLTSDPETWDSIIFDREHLQSDLRCRYSGNVIAADPGARLNTTTQVRDIMNDCSLPDVWINRTKGEISLDWHALCCRIYGEEKAMTDMLTIRPGLAQDAYVAWMDRVDQQCLSGDYEIRWRGNVGWRNLNNEKRAEIWLDQFLDRQKYSLDTWKDTMRKQTREKDETARGRHRLTSEYLLQKYSADLEIRFDKESGNHVIQRSSPLPPKPISLDSHTPLRKDLMPEAHWDNGHRTNAAIMERTRFLERGTKRERHEVTAQGNGAFRFSHYDSAEMPPTKRLKASQGIAIGQDFPEPYPLESLIGINAFWARDAWKEVGRHEIPYQRILNALPQPLTRHTYITNGVELLYKSWKWHYAKMLIAPPVYVHSVGRVEELLDAHLNPRRPWRIGPNKRQKRTPRSVLKRLQTSSNDGSENGRSRYNPFATIDVPGHNAKDGRTESHAVASSPLDGQRKVKKVKKMNRSSSKDRHEAHEKTADDQLLKPAPGGVRKGRKKRQL